MKTRNSILILALFLSFLFTPAAFADDDDTYLLRPAPGALQRVVSRYRLTVLRSFPAQNLYLVQARDDDDFEDKAENDPDIQGLEENEELFNPEAKSGSTSPHEDPLRQALQNRQVVNYFGDPVWSSFLTQPVTTRIGLAAHHSRNATGSGIVAVIDTGIDANHPLLRRAIVGGYDFLRDTPGIPSDLAAVDPATAGQLTQSTTPFVDSSTRPVPINQYVVAALSQSTTPFVDTGKLPNAFGHGTMVAGLIRLVAPGARIMPLKAFREDGSGSTFDLIRAIYYAADNGAQVINMSFNMKQTTAEMTRAVNYASARGLVLVSSAGNDGNEILVFPAAYGNVMGVASLSPTSNQRSGFSNYGPALVTLAAPGEGLVTAYPGNNYATVWGTSFSTPLVSGAVSLLLQRSPGITPQGVESALTGSAQRLDPGLGSGLLRVQGW